MRVIAVIPARLKSDRLPGKPLIQIGGRSLIEWVYRRVSSLEELDEVVVATDDRGILGEVERFGGKAMMTRSDHRSGTDRVAEAAGVLGADIVVNVQGDEPLIAPSTIQAVCRPFEVEREVQVTTARVAIEDPEEINSPDVVKVVTDLSGRALYFSRACVPFQRGEAAGFYKHLGIYAYRSDFLKILGELTPGPLERSEKLEQLRFLENGVEIRVVDAREDSIGVDTPADLERVRPLLENPSLRAGGRPASAHRSNPHKILSMKGLGD